MALIVNHRQSTCLSLMGLSIPAMVNPRNTSKEIRRCFCGVRVRVVSSVEFSGLRKGSVTNTSDC